jgi:hypothetical protein
MFEGRLFSFFLFLSLFFLFLFFYSSFSFFFWILFVLAVCLLHNGKHPWLAGAHQIHYLCLAVFNFVYIT